MSALFSFAAPNARRRPKFFLPQATVFQIDAAIPASYPGTGQTWANVRKHPADGLAQTAYDFWLGRDTNANTDDPTFSVNKFISDGGDFSELKTNTAFVNNLFRTNQTNSWWVAAAFKLGSVSATQTIYGNTNGSTTPGWRIEVNATPVMRFIRADGTQNLTTNLHSMTGKAGTPLLHIFSWNNATRAYKSALNSRTFTLTGTAVTATQTAANNGKLNFGSANHGTAKVSNGSELYGFAMGIGPLTNTDLAGIVKYYNALHGRAYA